MVVLDCVDYKIKWENMLIHFPQSTIPLTFRWASNDLLSVYWQVEVAEKDGAKTIFCIPETCSSFPSCLSDYTMHLPSSSASWTSPARTMVVSMPDVHWLCHHSEQSSKVRFQLQQPGLKLQPKNEYSSNGRWTFGSQRGRNSWPTTELAAAKSRWHGKDKFSRKTSLLIIHEGHGWQVLVVLRATQCRCYAYGCASSGVQKLFLLFIPLSGLQ